MNKANVQTFGKKDLMQEAPVHRIVCLLKVQLTDDHAGFPPLLIMHNFMKAKNPIQNETTFNKSRLKRADGTMSNGGKARGEPLSRELSKIVNESNWSKLGNQLGSFNFRNKC